MCVLGACWPFDDALTLQPANQLRKGSEAGLNVPGSNRFLSISLSACHAPNDFFLKRGNRSPRSYRPYFVRATAIFGSQNGMGMAACAVRCS
jgi:hypothetical protein